ncbi:hypothetical protein DC082_04900 [Ignatzschineria indica]|uniref:HTH cro/C1-type domain-containing protein n=2 Tax=Ignatzschineria indica TaxID=472583 RepID=A0A2U2ANT5_9GAMM|nr:hypothetical protein DC082_04900 [Ignatzschineria indica]
MKDEEEESMNAQELGAKLREIRLEKGLSIEQVSRVLSLRPALVEAMESGDYREIGALLYAKNYLKKYIQFLGVDDPHFSASVEALSDGLDPKSQGFYETSKVKLEVEEKKRSNNFKYYLLFVLVLLAIFAYLYQSGMIPSPFREKLSTEGQGAVSLPNERLPSLELEYNLKEKELTSYEEKSFEEILLDATQQQQDLMVNEVHGTESLLHLESDAFSEDPENAHLVRLDLQSELNIEAMLPALTSPREEYQRSGNYAVLGKALRNYAPLLTDDKLPLIDLGSKTVSSQFIIPEKHIDYLYQSPNSVRLGLIIPKSFEEQLAALQSKKLSLYDRESGYYPLLSRIVAGKQLLKLKREYQALKEEEGALNALVVADDAGDNLLGALKQNLLLQAEKEASISTLQTLLEEKAIVTIVAQDITTLGVEDEKGRQIANKVLKRGDQYQLEGQGIFEIYLGNPAVIDRIMVNGAPIPEYHYKPLTEEAVSIRFSLNSGQYL